MLAEAKNCKGELLELMSYFMKEGDWERLSALLVLSEPEKGIQWAAILMQSFGSSDGITTVVCRFPNLSCLDSNHVPNPKPFMLLLYSNKYDSYFSLNLASSKVSSKATWAQLPTSLRMEALGAIKSIEPVGSFLPTFQAPTPCLLISEMEKD